MTLSPSRVSLALACIVSAFLVLSSSAVAQEPSLEETMSATDDGKGKGKPPSVPSTGPVELAAIAVVGAGYLTYRRVRKS